MLESQTIDTARVEGGSEFVLARHDEEWIVRVDGRVLMSSRMHDSEEALAEHALERCDDPETVLVGGLGLGFTLRAVLDRVPEDARVTVAELVPELVGWNRTHLAELHDHSLDDPRCHVVVGDVFDHIKRSAKTYDVILLDVDNGPVALSSAKNQRLYSEYGVRACHQALRPAGVLAVWSSGPNARFERRLGRRRFRRRGDARCCTQRLARSPRDFHGRAASPALSPPPPPPPLPPPPPPPPPLPPICRHRAPPGERAVQKPGDAADVGGALDAVGPRGHCGCRAVPCTAGHHGCVKLRGGGRFARLRVQLAFDFAGLCFARKRVAHGHGIARFRFNARGIVHLAGLLNSVACGCCCFDQRKRGRHPAQHHGSRLALTTGAGLTATGGKFVAATAPGGALATTLGAGGTMFVAGSAVLAVGSRLVGAASRTAAAAVTKGADSGACATPETGACAAQKVNPEATSAEPTAAHNATRLDVFFTARSSLASTTLRSPHIPTPRVEAAVSASAVVGARVLVGSVRTARTGKREGMGGTGVSGHCAACALGFAGVGLAALWLTMRPLPCHSARTESENVRLAAGRSYTASASDESSRFGLSGFGVLTGVLNAELGGALNPAGFCTLAESTTAGRPINKRVAAALFGRQQAAYGR